MNSNIPHVLPIDSRFGHASHRQLWLVMGWFGLCATSCAMATAVVMWAPF